MTTTQDPIPARARRNVNDLRRISAADADAEPPEERLAFPQDEQQNERRPTITISTTVQHRGRLITIAANDMTADQFCDLLDRRGFSPPQEPQRWQTLPDGTPICPKHHVPMRLREKQGDQWHSHSVEADGKVLYCKGYAGKDSPGYEH